MAETARTPLEALEAVIQNAFGGIASRMAAHFDVSDQTVSWWRKGERNGRPVIFPAEYCPECERLTGGKVRCEELRPDVGWDILREQAGQPWDGRERRSASPT
jgi:DNA-binding transcriptional regulator YdaS (Cro superfamily)